MSNYYYSRLDSRGKRIYTAALRGLNRCQDSIRFPVTEMKYFTEILTLFSYDHPEIFYVNFHRFAAASSDTPLLWNPDYLYPREQIPYMARHLDEKISRIVSSGNVPENDLLQKCRWIHDTLVKNVSYSHEALRQPESYPDAYSVLGVFEKKRAVCEGISLAAALLGDRLGLCTPVITGTGISDTPGLGDSHGWNLVCINGKYAHLDVTWDMCLSAPLRFTRYDYFCISDADIRTDHIYTGVPDCVSGSGLSFFENTRRIFSDLRECETYITEKMKEGRRTFYFRLLASDGLLRQAEHRLQSFLLRRIALYHPAGASLETAHNLNQGIFFFRVKG